MPLSKASNATIAKVHAKYGRRLSAQNYKELISCGSVGEIANYLKTHTAYDAALSEIKDYNIHRGHLERLLKRANFNDIMRLCNFERTIGESFYEFFLKRSEIDELLSFVRLFNSNRAHEFVFAVENNVDLHSSINFTLLKQTANFTGLCEALKHTDYFEIFQKFPPDEDGRINYTGLNNALLNYLFDWLFNSFLKQNPANKNTAIVAGGAMSDIGNFIRIYRMKHFSYYSQSDIKNNLLPSMGRLTKHQIDEMVAAKDADEVVMLFKRTKYFRYMTDHSFDDIEYAADCIKYSYFKKLLRFSDSAGTVLYAYYILADIELQNIIKIIEGIRYELPPDKINDMLIYSR